MCVGNQVQGTALLPATALFEVAAAAAGLLAVCDAPVAAVTRQLLLRGAAVQAPCRLGSPAAAPLLMCSIDAG